MRRYFLFCLLVAAAGVTAQPVRYTISNTHSHNDYEQAIPFWMAYKAGFGSIEADIFLRDSDLLVGHDTMEIRAHRTLEEYYIKPLIASLRQHNGYPYADTTRSLQMLIDLKTDSNATLDRLVAVLEKYPALIRNHSVKWAMTGNRPSPARWADYPSFICFDGVLDRDYDGAALARIVMMSEDFKDYSRWDGQRDMPVEDRDRLEQAVARSHALHKPVRFWDAPDFSNAWEQLMQLGVDYINTDHIAGLAAFLHQQDTSF